MNMEQEINQIKSECAKHRTEYALMCKDIQDIKDDISEMKTQMKEFIASADNRFASKKVENVLWAAGGVIGTALLLTALKVIFNIKV